jgi:glycosyltransferase involved in cell wall biosynthesis
MTESVNILRRVPTARQRAALRVAMLAPPWIPVPPPGYGGIEAVVDLLCEALVARGHDVTLFAAPGSRSVAHLHPVLEATHPDTIGSSLHESDHVAGAFDAIDEAGERGDPFDVIHDHSGFTALAMSSRVSAPMVHTLHGPLVGETARFYRRHAHKAHIVAISRSQIEHSPPGVRAAAVVPNPIAVDRWPFSTEKDEYLLWIGRMDPVKGAHRAIKAARIAGRPLVLAGPVQTGQADYFREQIEPHIDGTRIRYIGEVTGAPKQQLYARASALLMPIRWDEPFGMVMIEALACGTPVIAFPEGAASEIVVDGHNGMLVADEAAMAGATTRLRSIDPLDCRESVRSRYDIAITADGYEAVYRRAAGSAPRRIVPHERGPGRFDVTRKQIEPVPSRVG